MKNTIAPTGSACHAVLALALASSCAYAQSENPTPAAAETELAPVTVSAHEGEAIPYDQTGVSVTVLDPEELQKEGIYTLTEALTTAPGVYVLPGGGKFQRGNTSDLLVRGMNSPKYVMPMLDGMRLNSGCSSNGLVSSNVLARTPLFGLGTLELLRGAEGAVYGSGAMGGVLFMETPEGKGDPSLALFNEYGSFDSYTGNVTAQGQVQDLSFFVSGTYERTGNDARFLDGSTPGASHAAKYQNWSEAVRLDYRENDRNKTTFTYRREDSSYNNYYDMGGYGDPITKYDFRTNLVTLKHQVQASKNFTTGLMAGFYDSTNDYDTSVQHLKNVQLEWRNAYRWDEQNKTTAGISWSRSDFTSKYDGEELKANANLDSVISLFAEHTVEPVKGWTNTLALRLDESNVYDALFTLRAASSYKFNRDRTRLFGSVGRGYSAPSSFERSNGKTTFYGTPYYGNPDLMCETNWSADVGAEQQILKDNYLSATYFWSQTKNAIEPDWNNELGGMSYANASSLWRTQGVELALRGTIEKQWNTAYKVAFTYAQPKKHDDEPMPNTARQVWTADIHTSPLEGFTTGVGLSAACKRLGYDGEPLDNYLVLRWYARYQVTENLSVHLRVENLTNQKYVLDAGSWDTPDTTWLNSGTAVYAGCTLTF